MLLNRCMKYILPIIILVSLINPSYAYLDPGSGGFLIQTIIGFVAAIFAYIALAWNKLKIFLSKFIKKKNTKNNTKH